MADKPVKIVNNEIIELTDEEIAERDASVAEALKDFSNVRMQRNGDLSTSDWTQLADAPLSDSKKAEWVTYRQELRDLPATFKEGDGGTIDKVVFPTKPS